APHWSGTNILTDAMFSSEYLDIIHDGAEAERAEKVVSIVDWEPDLVLDNLRVCHRNQGGWSNCGACYKCARTAVVLAIIDRLPEGRLFSESPARHWRSQLALDSSDYTCEALRLAKHRGTHPEIERMLARILNRRVRAEAAVSFARHSPLAPLIPLLQRLRDALGIAPRER